MSEFKIDLAEAFTHLTRPPVVEAVVQLTARPEAAWEESILRESLKNKLPDFPDLEPQMLVKGQFALGGKEASQTLAHPIWFGHRLKSSDGLQVVQFNKDGLVLSRLQPYESWDVLVSESMRLWRVFVELGEPGEVNRIGVRYINRIPLSDSENLGDFINDPPVPPRGLNLPREAFLHQETFNVIGHSYSINIIKTIQPAQPSDSPALILDIDVFTRDADPFSLDRVEDRLAEMRWLKNKAFFGSLTDQAIKGFH